jgi:hypothetical protein
LPLDPLERLQPGPASDGERTHRVTDGPASSSSNFGARREDTDAPVRVACDLFFSGITVIRLLSTVQRGRRRSGYLNASWSRERLQRTLLAAGVLEAGAFGSVRRCCCRDAPPEPEATSASAPFAPLGPRITSARRQVQGMHDIAPGEMHYIAADLDSREWVDAGVAKLEDYLLCWSLFSELYPSDPQ